MSGVPPLNFLDAVAGYVRAGSESSADRPIRLATVDPAYSAWTNYPNAPPPPRVTFDGEGTLSTKAYPYANGLIPWAGMRVYMVPIGNTWLIVGQVGASSAQGFWQSPDGLQAGLELGGGSYFDEESGLYIAGDISAEGDLSVGDILSPSVIYENGIPGTQVTASTISFGFVNMPAPFNSFSFTKRYGSAQTRLKVSMKVDAWLGTADGLGIWGVKVDSGADVEVIATWYDLANVHTSSMDWTYLNGIGAGAHTITGRWRSPHGYNLQSDANGKWSLLVQEVPVP